MRIYFFFCHGSRGIPLHAYTALADLVRRTIFRVTPAGDKQIELVPGGHSAGGAAALITARELLKVNELRFSGVKVFASGVGKLPAEVVDDLQSDTSGILEIASYVMMYGESLEASCTDSFFSEITVRSDIKPRENRKYKVFPTYPV